MVDLKELWVGDKLRIIKSQKVGTFEGVNKGKARIEVGSKILLVPAHNLELYVEPIIEEIPFASEEDKPSSPYSSHTFPDTIDLHIETLAPEMASALPARILQYQLQRLSDYLDQAEVLGIKYITIIHGKGSGVLKEEVLHLLKGRNAVKYILEGSLNSGATEVHMKTKE